MHNGKVVEMMISRVIRGWHLVDDKEADERMATHGLYIITEAFSSILHSHSPLRYGVENFSNVPASFTLLGMIYNYRPIWGEKGIGIL